MSIIQVKFWCKGWDVVLLYTYIRLETTKSAGIHNLFVWALTSLEQKNSIQRTKSFIFKKEFVLKEKHSRDNLASISKNKLNYMQRKIFGVLKGKIKYYLQSMVSVHHWGYTIKSKAIKFIFFKPPSCVRKKISEHLLTMTNKFT